jgi:beta-glucosidase-like glycosyl hydrolase
MLGTPKLRGEQVRLVLTCRKIFEHTIDDRVRVLLRLINNVMKAGVPGNAPEEIISAASILLLENEGNVLPFNKQKRRSHLPPGE